MSFIINIFFQSSASKMGEEDAKTANGLATVHVQRYAQGYPTNAVSSANTVVPTVDSPGLLPESATATLAQPEESLITSPVAATGTHSIQ